MHNNKMLSSAGVGDAVQQVGGGKHARQEATMRGSRSGKKYNVSSRYRRLEHVSETSLCYTGIIGLAYLLAMLASIVPTLIILLVCLPLGALLHYTILAASCLRYRLSSAACAGPWKLVSPIEQLWLSDCSSQCPSQTLLMLQGSLSVHELRAYVHERLVTARLAPSGRLMYPRFTQKVERLCGGDMLWVTDERFSVDNHVYAYGEGTGCSPLLSVTALQAHVARMAALPLSIQRPLWEMQLISYVNNQQQSSNQGEDGSCSFCILFRIHPALGDAASLVSVLTQVLTDHPSMVERVHHRCSVNWSHVWRCIKVFFTGFLTCLSQWVFRWRDRNELSSNGRLAAAEGSDSTMVVSWSPAISLEKINRIRHVTRTSVSDILLAVTTQVLTRHLNKEHAGNIIHVHATLPVHVRSRKFDVNEMPAIDSSYAFVDLLLPTEVEGFIPKLWHLKAKVEALKASSVPLTMYFATWLQRTMFFPYIFRAMYKRLLSQSSCFVSSLNSMVESRVCVASSAVTGVVCWVPSPHKCRLSFTFFTYAGDVHMAVAADSSLISSPDLFTGDFSAQIDVLHNMLALRRAPGEFQAQPAYETESAPSMSLNERAVSEIRAKIAAMQNELQLLKQRIEGSGSSSEQQQHLFSIERLAVVTKVQQLKSEFSRLLQELRRKQSPATTPTVICELATDHHVHEETMAAVTSLVEQPVVIIEQPPSRCLRDLDFIDHPSDMFDDLSVSTNNMLNTCARDSV